MANRINVKLILELKSGGMSQDEIARTRHMSRTSISTVVRIARERSISFEDIKDLNDDVILPHVLPGENAHGRHCMNCRTMNMSTRN